MWLDLATMASEGGSAPLLVVAAAQPGERSKCSHSKCSTPLLIVAAASGRRRQSGLSYLALNVTH